MATTIKTKNSTTAATAPTGLVQGELAVNITDKKLYVGDSVGNSIQIAGAGATNAAGGSNTQVQYNSSGALAGSSSFVFDGTNVGIGTSSPSQRLDVQGSSSSTAIGTSGSIEINSSTGLSDPAGITLLTAVIDSATAGDRGTALAFSTSRTAGTSEKMRIDSSGNVGIGTSSPAVKLDVAGNATVQNGVLTVGKDTLYDAFINTPESMYFNVDSDGNSTGNKFVWGTDRTGTSGGTTWMTLDSSGNLGLGVTPSGNYRLEIASAASTGVIAKYTTTTGVPVYISSYSTLGGIFAESAGNNGWCANASSNYTSCFTNGAERIRVDSSGNVGIGTNSPAKRLHLYAVNDAASVRFTNTAANKVWDLNPAYPGVVNSGFSLYNVTDNTVPLHVKDGGTVLLQGGSTSATGVGITFPASQSASSDANTLDDYEEGTWTPTIKQGITSPTYARQVGTYTKIGNVVHFQMSLWLSGGTKNSDGLQIQGLPFAAAAFNGGVGYSFAYVNSSVINSTTTNLPTAYGDEQQTYFSFYTTDGGSFTGNSLVASNFRMDITGAYRV